MCWTPRRHWCYSKIIQFSIHFFSFAGSTWLTISVYSVCKFFLSASIEILCVYGAELFPTCVRTMGLGSAYVVSRLGGIISPFLSSIVSVATLLFVQFAARHIKGGGGGVGRIKEKSTVPCRADALGETNGTCSRSHIRSSCIGWLVPWSGFAGYLLTSGLGSFIRGRSLILHVSVGKFA